MDKTEKTKNGEKGVAMLTAFGVIKKIGVYCYEVEISDHNMDGVIHEETESLIIIGNNEESRNESTEDGDSEQEGYMRSNEYTLESSFEMRSSEVMERFGLSESKIDKILGGENLELDDWDLEGTDYFSDCELSIEELREKRKIDSEPFDAEEIISKITSEYVITPKRKKALLEIIEKL
jgi:hypothetical protein